MYTKQADITEFLSFLDNHLGTCPEPEQTKGSFDVEDDSLLPSVYVQDLPFHGIIG